MSDSVHDAPEVASSERVYDGRVISLRVDEVRNTDGSLSRREVVEHRGAVGIVPLLGSQSVLMVTQYRHAVGEWLLEIPAGTIEEGEDPDWCAARELEEETGHVAGSFRRLFSMYVSPGYATEKLHVYIAEDLRGGDANPDADERIEVTTVRLADVLDLIKDGRIRDAKTIAALLAVLGL